MVIKDKIVLNSGLEMPLLGLGTWDLRGGTCVSIVSEAIRLGYRLIDTAQMYGNEREVGKAIVSSPVKRRELFVTTKLDGRSNSYQQARDGIESCLDSLSMSYIDLMLVHEPYTNDKAMYKALEEAYYDGKVKAIGLSNYNQRRFEQFIQSANIVPAVNQVECHLHFQKWDLQQTLKEHGTEMQAWSPLAQGKIQFEQQLELVQLSEKYGKSPAQIVLRFLTQRGLSVVPKTSRVERLAENIDIFDFCLTNFEMDMLKKLDKGKTLFSWTETL
ncbi:aldo/keto reductase [Streptococcus parasuis]|uniref:Aldo/keto reductase n=1 Tax=Streptococcus parasuis TaxID=1501662 RepID=A0A4Q8L2H0_9STRE|nr:aldo/keto reductase [Streptococcus parasuis]TAA13890.1 aldo/keto reductase [Streptococcus parasuis]